MQNFLACPVNFHTGTQFQQASRIRRSDDLLVCRFGEGHFFGEQVERGFRLGPVIAAGGAAAELYVGDHHFAAIRGEYPNRGFIERAESDVGNATGKKGNARAAGNGALPRAALC
jgi:hypothetical protein